MKEYNDELETERQLNASEKEENENMKRKYLGVVREKERFKLQTKDLSTQVTTLTREVEAARFGHTTFGKNESLRVSSPAPKESVTNTEKVLSKRLISFHSVSELQTKNIELLAVTRDLTAQLDKAEKEIVDERLAEYKKEVETANAKLAELKQDRKRQESLLDDLLTQRDMYKTIAEPNGDKSTANKKTDTDFNDQTQLTIKIFSISNL